MQLNFSFASENRLGRPMRQSESDLVDWREGLLRESLQLGMLVSNFYLLHVVELGMY